MSHFIVFRVVAGVLVTLGLLVCPIAAQPNDRPPTQGSSPFLRERVDALDAMIAAGEGGRTAALAALAANDHRSRAVALQALGHVGTPDDLATLHEALADDDRFSALLAGEAIARLVARGIVPATRAFPSAVLDRAAARAGVRRFVERTLFEIADRPTRVRWHHGRAYLPFGRLGSVAAPALEELAKDRLHFASDARAHALVALGRIAAPGSAAMLGTIARELADVGLDRLEGEDIALIRAGAIAGMAMVGPADESSVAVYLDGIDRADAFTRSYAAWGLYLAVTATKSESMRREIGQSVRTGVYFDQDESVLEMLAFCLQACNAEGGIEVLIERLGEQPRQVDPFLLERLYWMGPEVPAVRDEIERQLTSVNAASRVLARHLLGRAIGAADIAKVIEQLDKRPDWVVESTQFSPRPALLVLGLIGSPEAREAVLRLCDLGDDQARSGAALALGGIGGDGVAERLVALLDDRSDYVRFHAAQSLHRLGDKRSIPGYIDALETGNIFLGRHALAILEPLAGGDLGYDPAASSDSRFAALERWRAWLDEQREHLVGQDGGVRLDKR